MSYPCVLPCRSAGVLPLVCHAFHGLLAGPNAVVWPSLEFHADISTQRGVQRACAFLAWLAAHGSLLRTLHVSARRRASVRGCAAWFWCASHVLRVPT